MHTEVVPRAPKVPAVALPKRAPTDFVAEGARWRESLALIERCTAFTRRIVHTGDAAYASGQPFAQLHPCPRCCWPGSG